MIPIDQIASLPGWFSGGGNEADVVVSTRIRLARNLVRHPFPNRASLAQRSAVFETVSAACTTAPVCAGFTATNFLSVKPLTRLLLIEEGAATRELLDIEGDRGVLRHGEQGRVSIMINEEDHLRIQAMDAGSCAMALWKDADLLDTGLSEMLPFAFDTRRGFLTCCPTNAGTGLRVSFLLHLPGLTLTKSADQVLQSASQMGIATRGFFGEHSQIIGSLFQLSNHATLGSTEEEFIAATSAFVDKVIELERQARQRVFTEAKDELADKIHRALAILQSARILDIEELLNLTSAVRLGIESGTIEKLKIRDINRAILLSMPAHLQTLYDREMNDEELRLVRAETVRNYISQKIC